MFLASHQALNKTLGVSPKGRFLNSPKEKTLQPWLLVYIYIYIYMFISSIILVLVDPSYLKIPIIKILEVSKIETLLYGTPNSRITNNSLSKRENNPNIGLLDAVDQPYSN